MKLLHFFNIPKTKSLIILYGSLLFLLTAFAGAELSLEEKIGQMLMVGFPGSKLQDAPWLEQALHRGRVGGVILDGTNKNIQSPEQLRALTHELHTASKFPLWIAIDQEGGNIARLNADNGFAATLSPAELGTNSDTCATYKQSVATAKLLREYGIRVNFAPVVDLVYPGNFIANKSRSFSSNAKIVATQAKAFVQGHELEGVMSCLKHFPGHGSSTVDTHLGFADISKTWNAVELYPYEQLIAEHCAPAIMMAHVLLHDWDPVYPASLSPLIIQGKLRQQLGFTGLVFTDDLHMDAILKGWTVSTAVIQAIRADADVMVLSHITVNDATLPDAIIEAVVGAVLAGEITVKRIHESYARIELAKQHYGVSKG